MGNLILLLITTVLIFGIVFTLNRQDIMAPSVIVMMVFIFSILLTLYNAKKWSINYSSEAAIILALGLFVFGITDVMVANLFGRNKIIEGQYIEPVHIDKWKLILVSALDVGIIFLVLGEVRRIAATNSWYTNIFYAYRVITSHSDSLTLGQYMDGMVNQSMKLVIVSGFICAAFFVNNVFICKEKVRKNVLLLVPPLLLCMMTLFTGVRTNILRLCVFCLICGYILMQYKKNWRIRISWKFIRVLAVALVAVLALFGGLQSFLGRTGSTDIMSVIANYAGASIMHFNQYIQKPPAANEVFGQETFVGVWNILYKLGITNQLYSAHEEYRYITATDFGNVYTLFRRFIQDFGIFGMATMTVVLSAISSLIYNRGVKYRILTYKQWRVIIEYSYFYFIVAMASIDNLVHDYLNIGTIFMVILLHAMLWFMLRFKFRIHIKVRSVAGIGKVS